MKKIISLLTAFSLVAGIFSVTPLVNAATYTPLYSNDFEGVTVEPFAANDGTTLYGDWQFAGDNSSTSFVGGVKDGYMYRVAPWSTKQSGIKLSSNITKSFTADMHYEASVSVPTAEWWMSGAGAVRFGISADGKSFYEIGSSGCKKDDLAIKDLYDGTIDTQARYYIRKVVNGTQEYIEWENDDSGFYQSSSPSSSDSPYRRNKFRFGEYPMNIVIDTSAKSITYSVTAKKYSSSNANGVDYTWSGKLNDTSLIDDGTGFAVYGFNGQKGIQLNSISISTVENPNVWTDDFNRTVAESENRAGELFGTDWVCAGTYGSYPEWFHREIDGSKFVMYSKVSLREGGIVVSNSLKSKITNSMKYKGTIGIPNHGTTSPTSASGAATLRFAISDDGKSFYEVGCSGKKGDSLTYPEFQPKQGTYDWKTFKDTNGTTIVSDYGGQYCHYFARKVIDGVTVPFDDFVQNGTDVHPNILWENDPKSEGGFFAQSPTASSIRGNLGKTTADIVVTTSPTGFTFSVTALNSSGQMHTWSRSVADSELLGDGTGFGFFTFNGQHSMFNDDKRAMTVDDVSMTVLDPDVDPDATPTPKPTPRPTPTPTPVPTPTPKPTLPPVDVEVYRVDNVDGTTTFKDAFGGYTEENAHIEEETAVYPREYNNTIANNGTFKWMLSRVNSRSGAEAAFTDAVNKRFQTTYSYPKVQVSTGINNTYPTYDPNTTVVNMKFCEGGLSSLKSIDIDEGYVESSRNGFRFAVSEDEKSYYEVGRADWWDSNYDVNYGTSGSKLTGYPKRAPYVLKCVNGVREVIGYSTNSALANVQNATHWTITVDGSDITVYAKDGGNTYSYTFADNAGLLNDFTYPIALFGNKKTWFDNVSVNGIFSNDITPTPDVFKTPNPKPIKVAAVGDSNTGTYIWEYAYHTWPTRLGMLLGEDYIVENFGKPGYRLMSGYTVESGSNPSYIYCQEYQDSLKSNADIVLIMLGTNDFGWSQDPKAADAKFYADYVALVQSYKDALGDDTEFIFAVPPIRGTAENPDLKVETYIRPLIKKLAEDLGASYLDIANYMQDYSLSTDTLHFKQEAYFQFADCFYKAMMKQVEAEIEGNTLKVHSERSYYGNVLIAGYNQGRLVDAQIVSANGIRPEVANDYDVSGMDIENCDELKVILFSNELNPYVAPVILK